MSYRRVAAVLLLAVCLSRIFPARAADKPVELVDRVREAITGGVRYLKGQQLNNGSWEVGHIAVARPGGTSALALLALLNAGVKPADPVIQAGLKYLRRVEPAQTYTVSLQTMVFVEAGYNEDAERIQRNAKWLLDTMLREGDKCRGWTYGGELGSSGDNSNTQYALLGLHAAHSSEKAKIPQDIWKAIRDYYQDSQRSGAWVYNPAIPNDDPRLTMTTAGLCGLLISGMELKTGREVIEADGTVTNCGHYDENQPVAKALKWIGSREHFRPLRRGNQWEDFLINNFYSLYGLERAGRLSGLRFFGEFDWYRVGCEYLLDKKRGDGSKTGDVFWGSGGSDQSVSIISTSFALLFLSKGRTPILISKLVHGPGEDWNNDRNDIRNLVEYAKSEVFQNLPLGWQIFDTSEQDAVNDAKILALVRELLPSPILYLNGHKAPELTGVQKKLLKQYIDQGGFILAEACCSRPEFAQGFRELMKKDDLFPDNPLKPLPREHPIWQAHAAIPPGSFELEGIEYGCKTVVILSPQDLSCFWEANEHKTARGQLAFRMGGNIIAYATGMEPPKPRLTPVDVIPDDPEGKKIPRGYLKVAQVRHEGDWQPAPNAMRNLMAYLHKNTGLDVALSTKAIRATESDLANYKFLYMHGRGNFTLSPPAVSNLRNDLETGALLFADACCGKQAFDTSFRDLAGKLFPDKKLEMIPLTDDLYSKDLNGYTKELSRTGIKTVRCRTEAAGGDGLAGQLHEVAPYLEGIRYQNRWVVIYSKYDIGCALENHQSTDCLGHDHDSALKLAGAVVLYALKR